ncbi:MAG TPA: LTA synthase family protein [Dongiaceae bacterium]|nr:LTA synthase family protein [Dongiaceae bacterium]
MNWSRIRQALLGPAQGWRWPLYTTLILYIVFYCAIQLTLGQSFIGAAILLDLGVDLLLAFLVFAMARFVWPFLLFIVLYFALVYGGSTLVILMLGRPLLPEEIHNLRALVMILGPLGWLGIALPLAIFAGSFLLNLRLAGARARLAAAGALAIGCGIVFAPMSAVNALDRVVGNAPWSKVQNFYLRGGTVNLLQETMRLFAQDTSPPTEQEVAAAVARLRAAAGDAREIVPIGHRRNVHMLLLESFWDPAVLSAAKFSEPPMDPRFLELWRHTGYTQALSPAFGGQTANAEFEILCGFPVDQHAANFEYGVKNAVPCLPGLLRAHGYRSVAAHPNEASFWNRANVYRRIGFETFWSAETLEFAAEEKRNFMTDLHLFQQARDRLTATADGRPVFNFLLTIEGHWDYATHPGRQSGIVSQSQIPDVGHFANVMHFKSRDLMDIIETLRRDDPDALIVAFGDHLPILGKGFEAYAESGLLPATYDEFTKEHFDFSARTPLIVIDGRNGPLNLGTVPMYQVPHIVTRLLGETDPTIFDLAAVPVSTTPRPLPEGNVTYVGGKPAELCRMTPPSPLCQAAADWLRDVKLLDHDLFRGNQHALKLLGIPSAMSWAQ